MQALAKIVDEDFDENNMENEEELQTFKEAEDSDHYSEL